MYDLRQRSLNPEFDLALMEDTFDLAVRAIPEDEKPHPRVSARIVRPDGISVSATRNDNERGSHAEYLALKSAKETGIDVEGATLFTTLEPCTHRSSDGTIPCSDHVIKRGIGRVVVGMEDPNPRIRGKGIEKLRRAGIEVRTGVLEKEVRGINEAFIEQHRGNGEFRLVRDVLSDHGHNFQKQASLLENYLEMVEMQMMGQGEPNFGYYEALMAYTDFLALAGHFDPPEKEKMTHAFLSSLGLYERKLHGSGPDLPYDFHTTQVGTTVIGLGCDDPRYVASGLGHDFQEELGLTRDALMMWLLGCNFNEQDSEYTSGELTFLDRKRYEGSPYPEMVESYYKNILKILGITTVKSADMLTNLKRWLLHSGYLIREKPHLLGKYFFESDRFLTEGTIGGRLPQVPYRLARLRSAISRSLGDEQKGIAVLAAERYGREVQDHFSDILYNQE
jgi:pyrimidine deaminase RibD-like protein